MVAAGKRKYSRSDLAALLDDALEQGGTVIIKRPGRKDLVVMPAERLADVDTTAYLLASPRNRRRLLGALRDAQAGKGRPTTVKQLRKQFGL